MEVTLATADSRRVGQCGHDAHGQLMPGAAVAAVIDALGTIGFEAALLELCNSLGDYPFLFSGRECAGRNEFAPCVGYERHSFEGPATLGLRIIDRDDPMLAVRKRMLANAARGAVFIGWIDADEIRNELRRELIFAQHSIATRINMSALDAHGARHYLCLYRYRSSRSASHAERSGLAEASAVLMALLRRHWELKDRGRSSTHETALQQWCPELTAREVEVCIGLLRGRTLLQISRHLGIAATTVRTYQQRAFLRLGVRSRRELVERLQPEH